ncbi:MAG TPA: substrate-binding domain-containing protein [Baekduia sp.]
MLACLALAVAAFVGAGCGSGSDSASGTGSSGSGSGSAAGKKYVIGISNTLVGNGFREEMICAAKAQALASGKVSKVLVQNQNGGAPEQIAAIRTLISAGANAIVANPADASALNPVIEEAKRKGVVFVAVDQAVTAPDAYIASNDQVEYAKLGVRWLAQKLGGKGNIVEMRGAKGVPADTDRHKGFQEELKNWPNIKVVKSVYSNWDWPTASKEMLNILQSGTKVDGVWTSGIDSIVVDAYKTAGKPLVPIVGADNNGFLKQMINDKQLDGAAVTNPAVIGGVGTAIAIDALTGKNPDKVTTLKPALWEKSNQSEWEKYYNPKLPPTYSTFTEVKPYTTFTPEQLSKCQGPS